MLPPIALLSRSRDGSARVKQQWQASVNTQFRYLCLCYYGSYVNFVAHYCGAVQIVGLKFKSITTVAVELILRGLCPKTWSTEQCV